MNSLTYWPTRFKSGWTENNRILEWCFKPGVRSALWIGGSRNASCWHMSAQSGRRHPWQRVETLESILLKYDQLHICLNFQFKRRCSSKAGQITSHQGEIHIMFHLAKWQKKTWMNLTIYLGKILDKPAWEGLGLSNLKDRFSGRCRLCRTPFCNFG